MAEKGELSDSDSFGSTSTASTLSVRDQSFSYAFSYAQPSQLYSRKPQGAMSSQRQQSLASGIRKKRSSNKNASIMSKSDVQGRSMTEVHQITFGQALAAYKMHLIPTVRSKVKQSVATRGSVKHAPISQLKQQTNFPKGSLPRKGLDTWLRNTPDTKLPDIRDKSKGTIYYTRGRLGQKLVRSKADFDLSDPNINKKVLKISDYSALHDPHCKTYFSQPSVLQHLKKQKLINSRREVICNANEFNNYREYLADLFGDRVKQRMLDQEAMKDLERGISRSMYENQKIKVKEMSKEARAKLRQRIFEIHQNKKKRRYDSKINRWQKQLEMIEQLKKETQAQNAEIIAKRHWRAYQKRLKAEEAAKMKKRNYLMRICYAELKNSYVTKYDEFVKMALIERFKADQAAALVARDDQTNNMEELVAETLRRSREEWIGRYTRFVQRVREAPLTRQQTELLQKARIEFLERKYFDAWVEYTKSRKLERPDSTHQSVFDRNWRPFVANLKEQVQPAASDSAAVTWLNLFQPKDGNQLPTKRTAMEHKLFKMVKKNKPKAIKFKRKFKSFANKTFSGLQSEKSERDESRAWQQGLGPVEEENFDYIDKITAYFAMRRKLLIAMIRGHRYGATPKMSMATVKLAKTLDNSEMGHLDEKQKESKQRIVNIQSSYQALSLGKKWLGQSRSEHSQLRQIKDPSKSHNK